MKKVKSINGLVIAERSANEAAATEGKYAVFTKEEYAYGPGCRYQEWDCDSMKEAEEFAKGYGR